MLQTSAAAPALRVGTDGPDSGPRWLHLRSVGVSLLLEVPAVGLPVVRYWGADLGVLDGPAAAASLTALLLDDASGGAAYAVVPTAGTGPGLTGTHDGRRTGPVFADVRVRLVGPQLIGPGLTETGADTLVVEADDPASGISLDLALQLTASGLVRGRAGLTNRAAEPYRLDGLSLLLPAGEAAAYALDLAGLPVRSTPLRAGLVAEREESGRPAQVVVAEPGAGFRRGEVWHAHTAFSGAVTHWVEVTPAGRTYLGGGERLGPGEVVLGRGEAYHSPWVLWSWGDGLDAAAARVHAELRAEPASVPVVFDATAPEFALLDPAAMLGLAEYASAVGVETFLLDLGWCLRAGLDPFADHEARGAGAMPDDLAGLLARIRELDLEVGLAVALERVNPGSPIRRDHPEWLLEVERDGQLEPVLDLSVRAAMIYVWERLTKLLDRHPVSLLAWSPVLGARRPGSAEGQHTSTLAAYRLVDALRERYPDVVVLSSALDAGMVRRAVTAIGRADARRRHAEYAGLVQLLPPERLWQPAYDEVEGSSSPGYRAVAGFFGALGVGLDLRRQAPGSLRAIHRWLSLHKGLRPLLHSGRTVRCDTSDAGFTAHGVVAATQDEALYALAWLDSSRPRRVPLCGLDPAATYRLELVGPRSTDALAVTPAWAAGDAPRMTGQALATAGVRVPAARRGSALLVHLTAV